MKEKEITQNKEEKQLNNEKIICTLSTNLSKIIEEIIRCKWTLSILVVLGHGKKRPSQVIQLIPGLTEKLLFDRLKKLMNYGLVTREVIGDKPPVKVYYSITETGKLFLNVIHEIQKIEEKINKGEIKFPPLEKLLGS